MAKITKTIKISKEASKENLFELLTRVAEQRVMDIRNLGAMIIEEALKNKNDFSTPLVNPLAVGGSKQIIITVELEKKELFQAWARDAHRKQQQHACYILEKWCELNGIQ